MIRHTYYLAANSSEGYTSFMDDYAKNFKKIIILKNISRDEKEIVLSRLRDVMDENNIVYDLVIHASSIDDSDALIIPEMSCIISHEALFLNSPPLYSDIIDFYEELNFDMDIKKNILCISEQRDKLYQRMLEHMKEAKLIHDEWEKIYISNMDFKVFDDSAAALLDNIFKNAITVHTNQNGDNINRFFGTLLPRGSINYIDNLTDELPRRIFIKGRPGTGKSTLLKRIVKEAAKRGYDTETYYCSFDIKSLDMVVIRELGVCIFDSTSPHEKFPEKQTDEVFDIYDIAVNHDTDDVYGDKLMHISSRYASELKKAKECLYSITILDNKHDGIIAVSNEIIEKNIKRITAMSGIM